MHFKKNVLLPFMTKMLCIFSLIAHGQVTLAQDQPSWFQIEYILFEHLESDRHVLRFEEVEYVAPIDEDFQYITSSRPILSPNQLEQLSDDSNELVLNDALQRLKRSKKIKVLSSGAWKQAIAKDSTLPPIKLTYGALGTEGYQIGHDKLRYLLRPTEDLMPQEQYDPAYRDIYELEGKLQLKLSRYLHAEIDVYLNKFEFLPYYDLSDWFVQDEVSRWTILSLLIPPNEELLSLNTNGLTAIPTEIIHLNESRRIKVGEIQYIDHPAIGLIITIKKVEAPFEFGGSFE